MTKAVLRNAMQNEVWNVLGETIICKVPASETFGRFTVVEESSPPNGSVPQHIHRQTDEIIYVLKGRYEFRIGGKTTLAAKGETIVIPRNTPHGFRNMSKKAGKLLAIITPSGFEKFFAEVSKLNGFDMPALIEIGKRNDLEIVR